jgi:hypothetical protein
MLSDEKVLAALAVGFPAWHVWRSRDGRGREDAWNATRRRRPGCGALSAGVLGRLTADSATGLRSLLEQQQAVETGAEQVA